MYVCVCVQMGVQVYVSISVCADIPVHVICMTLIGPHLFPDS